MVQPYLRVLKVTVQLPPVPPGGCCSSSGPIPTSLCASFGLVFLALVADQDVPRFNWRVPTMFLVTSFERLDSHYGSWFVGSSLEDTGHSCFAEFAFNAVTVGMLRPDRNPSSWGLATQVAKPSQITTRGG